MKRKRGPNKEKILQETMAIRQFENRLAREVIEIFESARGEVLVELFRYDPTVAQSKGRKEDRIRRIIESTREILKKKYDEIRDKMLSDLVDLGEIVNEKEIESLTELIESAWNAGDGDNIPGDAGGAKP